MVHWISNSDRSDCPQSAASTRHRLEVELARFQLFFLWASLRGSIDVSRRALHSQLPLAPLLVDYQLCLWVVVRGVCEGLSLAPLHLANES